MEGVWIKVEELKRFKGIEYDYKICKHSLENLKHDLIYKNASIKELEAAERPEPVAWEGAEEWGQLAYELCAEEHGEECCNDLLWSGGVTPEPWGERWLKYEGEAKRMISLVRKFTTPQPAIPAGWQLDAKRWNFVMMTEPYALNLWNALPKEIYRQERHLNNAIDQAMLAAAPKEMK